ncbi:hypothetical protein GCM10007094_44710 [Pseudovibrio japonicus]|uniref:Uncharacterized protein n=1 Tax=Pseudovibrio japonicus TaxID=366534 RepID=A0ABQ3ETZ1_9HYPH|nr:hypothetical protein GCM10007094_44710 [Pseudovibrio japonicus]
MLGDVNGDGRVDIVGFGETGVSVAMDIADDILSGGAGDDTFVFTGGSFGHDIITDFVAGAGSEDSIRFATDFFADFNAVLAATSNSGNNAVITFNDGNSVTLNGVDKADLHADDFQFV